MKLGWRDRHAAAQCKLKMQNAGHLSQEQVREFLESSAGIEFAG